MTRRVRLARSYPVGRRHVEGPRSAALAELFPENDVSVTGLPRTPEPLLLIRCKRDGARAAGVWPTSHGPLLVTDHSTYEVAGGAYRWAAGFAPAWWPRLALIGQDREEDVDALPLPCPRGRHRLALTWAQLAVDVEAAKQGAPRVVKY